MVDLHPSPHTCLYWPGWVASANANAAPGFGPFNRLDEYWTVPTSPSAPADINQELLWDGLEGTNGQIIQPELWYSGNGSSWSLECQYSPDNVHFTTAAASGNPLVGDTIEGYMAIEGPAGGGYGDYWYCEARDQGRGLVAEMGVYTPVGAVFNSANLAVLEVQGISGCAGLPNVPGKTFQLSYLDQESTGSGGWDSFNDVRGVVPFHGFQMPNGNTPNCAYNWGVSETGGNYYPYVTWTP